MYIYKKVHVYHTRTYIGTKTSNSSINCHTPVFGWWVGFGLLVGFCWLFFGLVVFGFWGVFRTPIISVKC